MHRSCRPAVFQSILTGGNPVILCVLPVSKGYTQMYLPITIAILLILCGCSKPKKDAEITSKLKGPLSLNVKIDGRFARGWPWTLNVDQNRTATLTIESFPEPVTRMFTIDEQQIDDLIAVLEKERFFEMDEDYGEIVADGSKKTITINCGSNSHTVHIHFLMNWANGDTSRLREPARVVRVWSHIRKWFDDSEAVDLTRYDEKVLNAAPT
jgi:hypothetical protein